MYVQHFGLEHEPFSIAPDPRYLYLSERHREALAHLLYGLGGGGGFVMLTGEIGAGKTTVCRCFLEQVPAHCQVAYIFNPKLTVIELLGAVCEEFGIVVPTSNGAVGVTVKSYIDPLNRFLLDEHAAGRNCVLVIDEAQQLSAEVLEQLRLLTNLETRERKLLQIILVGQPELRDMLAQPGLEQLAQRVIARYHLGPLSEADTRHYLQHRLAVAGLKNASPLGPALMRRIHRLSGGVPRRINLLCDRALLGAYSQGRAEVDGKTLTQAAHEIHGDDSALLRSRRNRRWHGLPSATDRTTPGQWLAVGGCALGLIAVAAWGTGWRPGGDGTAGRISVSATPSAAPSAVLSGAVPVADPSRVVAALPSWVGAPAVPGAVSGAAANSANAPAAASRPEPGAGTSPPEVAAAPHSETLKPDELQRLLRLHGLDEAGAWRALAARWGATPAPGADACAWTASQGLNCFRSSGGLALVRQLDRPGLLTLRVASAAPVQVLLVGLGPQLAWLQIGPDVWPVAMADLAGWWRGDFATFWKNEPRVPGDRPAPLSAGAAAWLSERLGSVGLPARPGPAAGSERALRARLVAYQVTQGLDPDGLPGPLTMMALNRATGVVEPRLMARP